MTEIHISKYRDLLILVFQYFTFLGQLPRLKMDPLKEVRITFLASYFYKKCVTGECYYEESLCDASGLFSLSEEDIIRPGDLCLFKININMGKKDKTVRLG